MTAVAEFHWRRYSSPGNGIPLFQRDLGEGNDYRRMLFFYFFLFGRIQDSIRRKKERKITFISKPSRDYFEKMLSATGIGTCAVHVCFAPLFTSLLDHNSIKSYRGGHRGQLSRPRRHSGCSTSRRQVFLRWRTLNSQRQSS